MLSGESWDWLNSAPHLHTPAVQAIFRLMNYPLCRIVSVRKKRSDITLEEHITLLPELQCIIIDVNTCLVLFHIIYILTAKMGYCCYCSFSIKYCSKRLFFSFLSWMTMQKTLWSFFVDNVTEKCWLVVVYWIIATCCTSVPLLCPPSSVCSPSHIKTDRTTCFLSVTTGCWVIVFWGHTLLESTSNVWDSIQSQW